ncbi:MAG: hypothetical protein HY912_19330 [Desulfomonile tiedjei]|uniref:Uncharacterized protein n=1 Tax=Desulfomonile tiedjei TaxID=2358 RepID=A0A9D6V6S8_9BACT|nr:hypothetical protein [Desulfomonile tiedjei]
MKKLVLIFMLSATMALAPFAVARDASRDYLMHIWKEQLQNQKRWEAVQKAPTPAAREEALKIYTYNLPHLWEPRP